MRRASLSSDTSSKRAAPKPRARNFNRGRHAWGLKAAESSELHQLFPARRFDNLRRSRPAVRYNRQRSGDTDFVRDDVEGRGARKFLASFEAQPAMDCPAASKYSVSLQRVILRLVLPAGLVCVFSIAPNLAAQSPTGPQTPAKAPDVVRIPTTPLPEKAPPIPSEEIIRRFTAQEDEFAKARAGYTYRKIV